MWWSTVRRSAWRSSPCIQTLAHLNQIFRHGEYRKVQDTGDILLVGEERTYELIEQHKKFGKIATASVLTR